MPAPWKGRLARKSAVLANTFHTAKSEGIKETIGLRVLLL